MQIVYHLGAHVTDEARIIDCLSKNTAKLAAEGIALPSADRFRGPIAEALKALRSGPITSEMQSLLLDAIIDADDATRIVMSVDSMLCPARFVLDDGRLYPNAEIRTAQLRKIFADHEVEFHLGIRNPATFLPALAARVQNDSFRGFISDVDPMRLRWSEMLHRVAEANPGCRLTVWCNEDTPLIWPEVLREVAGHDPFTKLEGASDFLADIMSPEGATRMNDYLDTHPAQNEVQRRRIVAAFLDKFAREEEIEMDLDMTGWTVSYVEALSELYEEDHHAIAQVPGVNFIVP